LVPGPILASHPLDLQDFYKPGEVATAPVGPPSINIEAKLVGVQDDTLEKDPSSDPEGVLLVRGPSVGKLLPSPMEASYVNIPSAAPGRVEDDGWVGTGARAKVRTNGAFSIVY
jgi:long-chain acyl-CoA synthetase